MTAQRIAIVRACDSPQLLNFSLWPRQRELLADGDAEDAPRLHLWALSSCFEDVDVRDRDGA